MKKFLLAVLALACMGTVALAGPNANGVMFLHDISLTYTNEIADYCGLGTQATDCAAADVRVDEGALEYRVFMAYAAFPASATPRLKAVTFGMTYPADLSVTAAGVCPAGSFELPETGWPGSGTGTSIVWDATYSQSLVPVYWFAAYNAAPGLFTLGVNAGTGFGQFADDSVPSLLDDITAYGTLGFDMDGATVCPPAEQTGACCVGSECVMVLQADCTGEWVGGECAPETCYVPPTGACCINEVCFIYTLDECTAQGGEYQGDDSVCTPETCAPPSPVVPSTWGQIKDNYR